MFKKKEKESLDNEFNTKIVKILLNDVTELRFKRNYFKVMRKLSSLKKIRKYYTHKFLEIINGEPLEITNIECYILNNKMPVVELTLELDYNTKITEPTNPSLLSAIEYLRSQNKHCAVDIIFLDK